MILPEALDTLAVEEHQLLLHIGEQELYISIIHRQDQVLTGYLAIHHNQPWREDSWSSVWIDLKAKFPWLGAAWSKIYVFYQQGEVTLIPANWFQTWYKEKILEVMFGSNTDSIILSDLVPEASAYNLYQVPRWMHGQVLRHFNMGECWHQRTSEIRELFLQKELNCIKVVFYPNRFVITMVKEGELQLSQTFDYTSPEDVTYQMLQLVHRTGLSTQDTPVRLQGMIEEHSGVYREVSKYFMELSCERPLDSWQLAPGFDAWPSHYFTSVLTAAACV